MTAPVVHSLREQIREHILEGIISGRWQPGERIVERRIATELEVSQTPVREALRELESLRLIESAPDKGVRVRNLSATDLEESYPVRAGLEAIAAELAADRLAEDCSALEPHVAALYEADRVADGTGQVRHTVAFHRELVRAAGNSVLLHTWEGLGIEVFTALSIRWLGTVQQSYAEEHQDLVTAFRRRDPRIAEIVKAHVLGCAPGVSPAPGVARPGRGRRTAGARTTGRPDAGRDTHRTRVAIPAETHAHLPKTPLFTSLGATPPGTACRLLEIKRFSPEPFDRSSISRLWSPAGSPSETSALSCQRPRAPRTLNR
ncbi:hypothetical protein SHIRM173S_13256 [Streptomyces hirsutus]